MNAIKNIQKLQRAIVDGLEDVKGQGIVVFNTEHLSSLFERVIVASGLSNRQTKALASSVREAVKAAGFPVPRMEGEDNGEWIIVDCGAAVAHIMQPAIRDYYRLEEIWGGKAVRLKLAAAGGGLVKASEEDDEGTTLAPRSSAPRAARARKPAAPRQSATGESEAGRAALGGALASAAPAVKLTKPSAPRKVTRSPVAPAKTAVNVATKTATKTAAKTPARKTRASDPVQTVVITPGAPKVVKSLAKKPGDAAAPAAKRAAPRKAPARKTTTGTVGTAPAGGAPARKAPARKRSA